MNKIKIRACLVMISLFVAENLYSQKIVTLQEVLRLGRKYSIEYKERENVFIDEYWAYKQFTLDLLPKFNFSLNPFTVNRTLAERYDYENNVETFRETKTISSNTGLNITQSIPLTGASISLGSNISRIENFGDGDFTSFGVTTFRVSLNQPLFKHNPYKWDKKELPLKLKKAKCEMIQFGEQLNQDIANLYFELAEAYQLYKLSQQEVSNSDALLRTGEKLLRIDKITPLDLVELELKQANANISLANREKELENARFQLDKMLEGNLPVDMVPIVLYPGEEIQLALGDIMKKAHELNPFYIDLEQKAIDFQRQYDQIKKQNRLSADLNLSYGLNQGGETLKEAFQNPVNQQTGSITLSIPVFDWGISKRKKIIDLNKLETDKAKLKSVTQEFEQSIKQRFYAYSIDKKTIQNADKARKLAMKSYTLKLEQYKLGKITLQELNQIQINLLDSEKEYINGISRYWSNLFALQALTLHDLHSGQPIRIDFDEIINSLN